MNISDMLKNLNPEQLKEGLEKISPLLSPEQKKAAKEQIENISKGDKSVLGQLSDIDIDKKDGQNQDILSMLKNNPMLVKNIASVLNKKK